MSKYTDEFLEQELPKYLQEVLPKNFSWGNRNDVAKLIEWIELKEEQSKTKEYILDKDESLTIMDMVQDCIDRGMIARSYETDKLEDIIDDSTNEFEQFTKDFEIIIRVKDKNG